MIGMFVHVLFHLGSRSEYRAASGTLDQRISCYGNLMLGMIGHMLGCICQGGKGHCTSGTLDKSIFVFSCDTSRHGGNG